MIIEVRMGKIVAKHEEMPEQREKSKYYGGPDDIVVLKSPEISKLNMIAGGDALKSTDKNEMAAATWAAMEDFEVPAKVAKAQKEKKERAASGPRLVWPEGKITVLNAEHGKRGVRKEIFDHIVSSATIEELRTKKFTQKDKEHPIPLADVFFAINAGIIKVG